MIAKNIANYETLRFSNNLENNLEYDAPGALPPDKKTRGPVFLFIISGPPIAGKLVREIGEVSIV